MTTKTFSNQHLYALAEVCRLSLWAMDLKQRQTFVSERMLALLGRQGESVELSLDAFFGWISPDDREPFQNSIRLHIEEGIPFDVIVKFMTQAGTPVECELKALSVSSPEGTELELFGTFELANARELSNEELRRLLSEHQRLLIQTSKMSAVGEMSSGIAHEINNPLAIIQGKTSFLKRKTLENDFEQKKFVDALEKIEAAAIRIGKVIQGLKSASRDAAEDPFSVTSVCQIYEQAVSLCQERFKKHGVELRFDGTEETIECRSTQIAQVLIKLLNNAFDSVSVLQEKWVEVKAIESGENVVIQITDSGNGIPPEVAARMRIVVKDMVEDHGGKFFIDSSCPNTRFVLELPKIQKSRASKAA